MVVEGKIVSQLCDEEGNMTELEFKEAMRKQVLQKLASRSLCGRSSKGPVFRFKLVMPNFVTPKDQPGILLDLSGSCCRNIRIQTRHLLIHNQTCSNIIRRTRRSHTRCCITLMSRLHSERNQETSYPPEPFPSPMQVYLYAQRNLCNIISRVRI